MRGVTGIAIHLDAAVALMRRDLQLFLSYRTGVITTVLSTFFSLTLFHFISRLVKVSTFPTPDAYYAYVVVGLVILQILTSTLGTPPNVLRQELVSGTFERLVLSPFGPVGSVISLLAFPLLMAQTMGLVTLAFAGVVFGLDIRWETAALAVPLGLLGALAFAPFGLLMLAVGLLVKQAASGTSWIIAAISLIAGVYFPITLLPEWIQWASEVQPFTPAVNLLRNVLVGTPLEDPALLEIARVAGFALLLLPASAWVVGRAVEHSRRRGTLIEY